MDLGLWVLTVCAALSIGKGSEWYDFCLYFSSSLLETKDFQNSGSVGMFVGYLSSNPNLGLG